MKIKNLHIERKEAFDPNYPNQLVGLVQLQGPHGKTEVKLSSLTVSDIFKLIKEDVQHVANYNASQASSAVDEAQGEALLLEQDNE